MKIKLAVALVILATTSVFAMSLPQPLPTDNSVARSLTAADPKFTIGNYHDEAGSQYILTKTPDFLSEQSYSLMGKVDGYIIDAQLTLAPTLMTLPNILGCTNTGNPVFGLATSYLDRNHAVQFIVEAGKDGKNIVIKTHDISISQVECAATSTFTLTPN